jgi:hypothetical protein
VTILWYIKASSNAIKSQTININVFKFKIGKVLPYILATKIDINNFKVK